MSPVTMPRVIFEPEHELFRDSVRRFFQKEIGPSAERWRAEGCVGREAFRKAGELGYLLMWAPEEFGGQGLDDFRFEQILAEENIRHGETGFYCSLHSRVVAPYVGRLGTDAQKARFLQPAARGEAIFAVALTEPSAGSDLAGMTCRAEDCGNHWLLNGAKTYISNGLLADVVLVAARTDPSNPRAVGLFLVERGMEGFERGRKLGKLGLDAQDTAELFFSDVRVPKANVLGDPSQGFRYLGHALAEERLMIAVMAMAHVQVAFDLTLDYVKTRRAFGRPVGTFQDVRFRLARMRTEIDALQCFVDQCVMLHVTGALSAETASGAKMLATELEGRAIDDCLQMHGGAGYMNEYRISRMYRDARISRIFGGANEIMAEIVGRGLGLDERKLAKPSEQS
jgi:acyl-CoA dehydrogenase